MSHISYVIALLQGINETVPGITLSPYRIEDYPAQLRTSQLPIALTVPVAGQWTKRTHMGNYDEVRDYRIMVYVDPVAQGKPFEYAEKSIELLNTMANVYLNTYRLGDNIWLTFDGAGFRDSGLQVLTYAGIQYHGFEFTINVRNFN